MMYVCMFQHTPHSQGGTLKFRLPCAERLQQDGTAWLGVKGYLTDKNFQVLLASLHNYKDVVVKFGKVDEMQKEYDLGHQAYRHQVPNFMRFLCSFSCNDSVRDIENRDFSVHNFVCKGLGDQLGILVMPYYPLGSLDKYAWSRGNLHVLKNVLHQVVFAMLYAYERFSFVHGDMHVGNVLLRASKKKQIAYGSRTLLCLGLYAMVMDVGRSYQKPGSPQDVYRNIDRFLSLILNMDGSDLALEIDRRALTQYISKDVCIGDEVYESLHHMMDGITIRYVVSERPKIAFACARGG